MCNVNGISSTPFCPKVQRCGTGNFGKCLITNNISIFIADSETWGFIINSCYVMIYCIKINTHVKCTQMSYTINSFHAMTVIFIRNYITNRVIHIIEPECGMNVAFFIILDGNGYIIIRIYDYIFDCQVSSLYIYRI